MTTFRKFYITLPSNVKSNEYIETNRITNYKTSLSNKIEFPKIENWEVGLAEISYSKSWYNVREKVEIKFYEQNGINVDKLHINPDVINSTAIYKFNPKPKEILIKLQNIFAKKIFTK